MQPKWHQERKYYKGWSSARDIYLFYKDENDVHKTEIIKNFPFYFLVKYSDFVKHCKLLKYALSKKYINKMSKHPYEGHDKWVRVYVNKFYERNTMFNTYAECGEWNKLSNVENLIVNLEKNGLNCYEADLSPLHRFLADYDINIDDNLRRVYLDIETDDTIGGFDDDSLARNRILSFAWYDDNGNCKFEISKSNDDRGEKELLQKLYSDIKSFDAIIAWNGANFDYKVIRNRMQYHRITLWNRLEHERIHSDLLEASKRNAPSGEFKSFALGNVGEKVCGLKKIDHTGIKIIDLWKSDKEKLKQYNLRDAEIMYRVEKAKCYQQNDIRTAKLGHRFANYFNISTKVEGTLLFEANRRGIHYPTVKKQERTTYEGGYVQEPVVGMYEGVAIYDFSSLYPSIISSYNVSHDVLITKDELTKYKSDDVITTPVSETTGAWYRKTKIGLIPEVLQMLSKERYRFEKLKDQCEHGGEEYWRNYWNAAVHKTMILSFYGTLGDNKSRFFDVRLARTITLCGQFYAKFVAALSKKMGYIPLYSDTDSIFIQMKEDKIDSFLEHVHSRFENVIKKFNCNPGFMKVNFESYYTRIVLLRKKRYAGVLKIHKGMPVKDFINVRGLETRRSDIPDIAKDVLNDVMKLLFIKYASCEEIVKYINTIRQKILTGNVLRDEIVIYKSLSKHFSEYEGSIIDKKTGQPKVKKDGTVQKKSIPIHVKIAKKMQKQGKEFYIGSQIPFIVTEHAPLNGIHESEYKEGHYDKEYYFDSCCYDPSKRLIEVAFPNYDWDSLYVEQSAGKRVKIESNDSE